MPIIQRSDGRNIIISSSRTKVTVNGRELPPDEAKQVVIEAVTKISRSRGGQKPSPSAGDNVTVVNSFGKK